jgi:hypothetical protein
MMQHLIRRDFLKLSLIALLANFFGCSKDQELDSAIQEDAFGYFLDVIFPSHLLGFQAHQKDVNRRLINLRDSDSKQIVRGYHLFKDKYANEHGSFESYTLAKGEEVIAQLLSPGFFSEDSETINRTLDIIYGQIAKIRGLQDDLWGRKYSKTFTMCAYWDSYDKPII